MIFRLNLRVAAEQTVEWSLPNLHGGKLNTVADLILDDEAFFKNQQYGIDVMWLDALNTGE